MPRQLICWTVNNLINLRDFLKEHKISFNDEDVSKKSRIKIGKTLPTVYPADECELIRLVSVFEDFGVPYRVVGALSNILICQSFEGVLIMTERISSFSITDKTVIAGTGARFIGLISAARRIGLSLLPELSGIPGRLGGMIYSNAGAFGREISDCVLRCRLYDAENRRVLTLVREQMHFSYRRSILSEKRLILLSAELASASMSDADIAKIIKEVSFIRRNTQPHAEPSLGSTFKRPDGDFAARLIDALGLKGYRVGGAEVSSKHAGFIVNTENAEADDVIKLIGMIKRLVFEKFGVLLEEEIEILR